MSSIFEKKILNGLSVDWDFFFPNSEPYDWGMDESKGIYLELVWATRAGNRPITDPKGSQAVKTMVPDRNRLDGFWEKTVMGSPICLAIAESHRDLNTVVETLGAKGVRIVNYDAHHDAGYGKKDIVDCGNWAQKLYEDGHLREYTVVYPEWRKNAKEPKPRLGKKAKIVFEPPPAKRYDFVFVCRSGQWTPTWADDEWLKFIGWWETSFGGWAWREKLSAPYSLRKRSPTMEESIKNAKAWDALMKRHRP